MKILISEKISQNRYKTPEGFLVCLNCILSRTGKQTYTKSEVFGGDDETEIEVDRTPQEVFSPQTLASFENKPLTIQHPDEDVTVENYGEYAKGFIRNIRKGTDNGQDVMIGDIVVTDKEAIEKIESGELLDLSCGYDCDIQDEEHPQQRNIRGNHVALCEQGRAGCARIVDSIKDYDIKIKLRPNTKIIKEIKTHYLANNKDVISLLEAEQDGEKMYIIKNTYLEKKPEEYTVAWQAAEAQFDNAERMTNEIINKAKKDSVEDDLIESASEEAFKKNIETEIKAGKPVEQAVAIAYSIQRKHQQDNQTEAEKVVQKANEDFKEYMEDADFYDDEIASNSRELYNIINKWLAAKPRFSYETVNINGKILSGKFTLGVNGGDVLVNYQPKTGGIIQNAIKVDRNANNVSQSDVNEMIRKLYAHAQEVARRESAKNIKFLYIECRDSENQKLYMVLKGKRFTEQNINELNRTLFNFDDVARANGKGYWKTYFDAYYSVDGKTYKQSFGRVDVGDGYDAVQITPRDFQRALDVFRKEFSRNDPISGINPIDSVKDSRKTYEVKSKDKQGNIIVKYVKADSFMDAVKQKDATENDISKLTSAFQMAKQAANLHRNDKDGGASNFDTAIIFLDNFNINQVKKAATNAGLVADKYRGHSYFIYGYQEGQGFRYTNMAKAFAESMKQQGYDASVHYRID